MHTKTNSNLALVHFQACNLEELEHNGKKGFLQTTIAQKSAVASAHVRLQNSTLGYKKTTAEKDGRKKSWNITLRCVLDLISSRVIMPCVCFWQP